MDALEKYFHPGLIEEAQKQNPFLRLNDLVYSIIEKAIVYGGLPPGTRLSIVKIANLLNVSHTPVSDALDQLQKEGLVVSPPSRKGHYVLTSPTPRWSSSSWPERRLRARRLISAPGRTAT